MGREEPAAHLGEAHNPHLLLSPATFTLQQADDHLQLRTCQQTPSSCHLCHLSLRMVCFQRCCCCVNLRTGGLMMGVMTLALSAFSVSSHCSSIWRTDRQTLRIGS